jgi:hypothetical protein
LESESLKRKEMGKMKKNSLILLLVGLVVILGSDVFARSWFDQGKQVVNPASRIRQFSPNEVAPSHERIPQDMTTAPSGTAPRHPLGIVTTAAGSPGVVVDNSYHDWQWTYPARRIDWRGRPHVQFSYNDRQAGDAGVTKLGYNVYNPIDGSWPRGQAIGCEHPANVGEQKFIGLYPTIAMNSRSRVVLGGYDNVFWNEGSFENAIYFQPTAPFSCSWGGGTRIDSSQYKTGMINYNPAAAGSRLLPIMVEVQEWLNDTVTHVLATQSTFPYTIPGCSDCTGQTPILYFRKMTFGNSGTWVGPTVLDTAQFMCHLAVSRVSPKVVAVYSKITAGGIAHNQSNDATVMYRENDSLGVAAWDAKVDISPYDRAAGESYSHWFDARAMYDSNDKLHIVWHAQWIPKDPYGTNWAEWNYYVNGMSLLHWSTATGTVSRVYNGEWFPHDPRPDTWADYVCGFVHANQLIFGDIAMSECNGHLYVVWSMGSDPAANPPRVDDCTSGGTRLRNYAANGEIYMSVSSDLSGLLWDKHRNLTNTVTPGCDSAGYGGVCYSDIKPTMSTYGMDITSFDTNGIPVTLTWPDTGINPGPGPYTGNHYTHLFFVQDEYPDIKALNATANPPAGRWTSNPLKWMRLACVAPISAPQISFTPSGAGYPDWTKHGKPDTTIVTVTNDGNATLSVTTIGIKKTTQTGLDWLGTTAASLSIPAGVGNTQTFGIIVNKGGAVNSPGTIVALTGEVYLKSNVAVPRDSLTVYITNFLVADTLVNLKWDTVSTSCTRLVVSSNGDIGRLGEGTVNMDYVALNSDCDSASAAVSVYAYSGGPIAIRKSGADYIYSNALFQGAFTTEQAFKPYSSGPGADPASGTGYDGFYTGTFVNKDTTIGVRRNYYAPTAGSDSCNFVIQKSVFFGIGGTKTGVTLGEVVDWDIPSYTGSNNDGRVLTSKNIVYQQGLDTSTTRCIKRNNRLGASVFLGQWTNTEKAGDPTFYDDQMYGAYAMLNDTLFKYDTLSNTAEGAYFWNQMGALSGLTAAPFQAKDLHSVITYKHNITLDTLTVFTAYLTVKNGDTSTLKAGVDKARRWFLNHLCPGCPIGNCCTALSGDGRTGNVDGDPGFGVDISDLSALIDFLYISFTPPPCMLSANTDGDPSLGVDISDLSTLIDFLYISFTPPALCPN